jgi:hypothetical protein
MRCGAEAFIAAFTLLATGSVSGWSADFSKSPVPNSNADLIAISGDLALGDERKFIDLALSSQNALVVFQSPGGNVFAAIEIGKAIHLKGFTTLVPDGLQCASACALAWLGGRVRLMSDTARVGFHAAHTNSGGQPTISSAANALVGAYLNQLGLPETAIVYITGTSPEGMQWLNFADAQRFGIDVQQVNLSAEAGNQRTEPRTPSVRAPRDTASSSQLASIKSATYDFITATNRPNDQVLFRLENEYDDHVNYFGRMLPKASVLADRQTFFLRWPKRNYAVRPNSIVVTCENERSCSAQGILDWTVSAISRTSTGSAVFSLLWTSVSGIWKVSLENSRVASRQISPYATSDSFYPGPRYQLDDASGELVSLSNLNPAPDCVGALITGKIVRREFRKDGLMPTGIVVEAPDGSREFVNTGVELGSADNGTRGWVLRGLQTLLSEGRFAEMYVRVCGAGGRVEVLDALR